MKRFTKQIGGKTVIKKRNDIVLKAKRTVTDKKTGETKEVTMSIYNPKEEQLFENGWVEYVAPEPRPIPERVLIERTRRMKLDELHRYDESSEVNNCIIVYQGEEIHYWADKTERNDLKNAVRDCIAMGRDIYRLDLRDKGVSINLPCEALLQMLSALEIYAIDCYNRTTDHEFAIKALNTKEEIEAYDFKVGYPSIPRFEV